MRFTDEQRLAVERRSGPLLLAANAGSGKTTVLVERLVRLATEDGIRPGRVLAITFTDKAAGELRARVRERFAALGERDLATEAESAWISTVHGFCARVLRAHAIAAGLDPGFRVLDEQESRGLRGEAFEQALAGFLDEVANGHRQAALDLVAARTVDGLAKTIGAVHDELRSRGATRPALPVPERVPPAPDTAALRAAAAAALDDLGAAGDGARVAAAREKLRRCADLAEAGPLALGAAADLAFGMGGAKALSGDPCAAYLEALEAHGQAVADHRAHADLVLLDELLGRFADAYARGKRQAAAVDYDDLELLTRDLLRDRPAIAATYRERFQRVMVDEFQDTNPLQLDLLRRIDSGHTFLVGDELQSIYGFRHADVAVFRGERDRLAAQGATASLARNFRSAPEVLETLDAAFTQIHGAAFTPLVPGLEAGARAWDGPRVELLVTDCEGWDAPGPAAVGEGLPAAQAWRCAEARLVAQRIADLVDGGAFAARDVVVLLRAASDMATYEQALRDAGLPTLAAGAGGFWARRQVLDLCAHLAVLANPRDEPALFSLLACPLAGLTPDALAVIGELRPAGRRHEALDAPGDVLAALPEGDARRLAAFAAWWRAERALAPRLGLDELLERAVAGRGYDLHVLGLPDGRRRLANVLKLARLAARFEARRGRDVRAFIDLATAEVEAGAREPDAPVELGAADAVRLMTMHAAKGLEFPVVVCGDLGRSPQSASPDLVVGTDGRVGLRAVDVRGGKADAFELVALRDALRDREAREDDRVHYVAMTRAEELLVLAGAAKVQRWPSARGLTDPPITWLGNALVPDLATRLRDGPAEQEIGWEHAGHRALVRLVRSTPGAVGDVLRELRPAPQQAAEQLGLAVDGSAALPDVPAPPPPGLATLSYSSLSRYSQCAYRWYLQRVLQLPDEAPSPAELERVPEAAGGGFDRLLRGSIVHALLEHLDLGRPAPPSDDAIRAVAHDAELTAADLQDVRRLVQAFVDSPLRRRLAAARGLRREHAFAFALADGPLVNGVVDVLAHEADGTALIVDYKTDDVAPDDDLDAAVERSYGTQRRIYALAALRAGAPAVEVVHLYLARPDAPVVLRAQAGEAGRLEADLQAVAAGLLAGRFEVTPQPHAGLCLTCPGRRALCSHPPERTLSPSVAA